MRLTRFLLFLLFVVGVLTFFIFRSLTGPVSSDTNSVTFTVTPNASVKDIADNLYAQHLIKSTQGFLLEVKLNNIGSSMQAGDFQLSPSMSAKDVATALTKGPQDVWVTIPEGLRAEEIDTILMQHFGTDYRANWKTQLKANEGYLFPDTYSFHKDATIDTIIATMRDNFEKKYTQAAAQKTASISKPDAVIIASIAQREAITPEDMRGVSSVLENRLRIGMLLGSDVTVEYAIGYDAGEKTWWKKDLTVNDLASDSPYNTRKFAGLPPGPICNPGLSALIGALNPTKTPYLYFIADRHGVIHYATTQEEHDRNVAKYL